MKIRTVFKYNLFEWYHNWTLVLNGVVNEAEYIWIYKYIYSELTGCVECAEKWSAGISMTGDDGSII